MNIAIIGTGNIGTTLGKKWLAQGHQVNFGARDINSDKIQTLKQTLSPATFQSNQHAVQGSEVVLMAVPGKAVEGVMNELGQTLDSKIIIDAANVMGQDVMHGFEYIQRLAPQAKRYRAFNSLGWENFENPVLASQVIDHFYCGDSGPTQESVHKLIQDIGLNPIYLGGLEHTSTLDALTRLWFTLAFQKGYGRRVALKVLSE